MKEVALPLAGKYKLDFDRSLVKDVLNSTPGYRILMEERGNYLVLRPVFEYGHIEVSANADSVIYDVQGRHVQRIFRNKPAEDSFIEKLRHLHSKFIFQEETGSLILKGEDVLKDNWFFLFTDAIKEMKVPLYGMESLRNFRFNSYRPGTHVYLSSGTDWFDARVDVNFGDQKVSIQDIKNALSQRQNFVQLGDGTLGILPEEWLKKYSLLFRVGQAQTEDNKLRLGKYHLGVIDELYEQRDEEELTLALDEKYENLRNYKEEGNEVLPHNVHAELRPYQVAGYQWLRYLNKVGWGGILADDMGLGKTLQAITVLQAEKNNLGTLTAIVVCPTTLIYNWRNEITKFTPELTYTIHHGNQRSRNIEGLTDFNIIITTYGTLRSDIQMLLSMRFDYIVLDESQAIKNPSSKVARAATLLKGNHRICMSGTPLQNNTFDIYSQMNFLKPGLLGSVEFFRNEFATPIDKFGEEEQKMHLKKLLYPFILRRTKDQVAKDLPEKTETILYCEMEAEQRRIYDAYSCLLYTSPSPRD